MIREAPEDRKNNKHDYSGTNNTLRTTTSTMAVNKSANNITHQSQISAGHNTTNNTSSNIYR